MGDYKTTRSGRRYRSLRRKYNEVSPGHYYLYTIPYGLYYLIGAAWGYSKMQSLICLFGSGSTGLVITLLGIGHLIEHRRGIEIEHFYTVLPLVGSFVIAVLMTCFYGLGAKFMPSGFVGIVGWVSVCVYLYAVIRDIVPDIIDPDSRFRRMMNSRFGTSRYNGSNGGSSNSSSAGIALEEQVRFLR